MVQMKSLYNRADIFVVPAFFLSGAFVPNPKFLALAVKYLPS
jgi:hypothetical protein